MSQFKEMLEVKLGCLNRCLIMFNGVLGTLKDCGLSKFVDEKDLRLIAEEDNVHKWQDGEKWFKKFVDDPVAKYRRLRRENTEEAWDGYELHGMTDHPEYREMLRLKKLIKSEWFDHHNPLLKPKKEPKKHVEQDEGQKEEVKTNTINKAHKFKPRS